MAKVSIQAGHLTGKDSGAVNGSVQEAKIVEDVVKYAVDYLSTNYESCQIFSKNVTKEQAVNEANANGVDLFVEVHCNSASSQATGFESFRFPNSNPQTVNAQSVLHDELFKSCSKIGVNKNRGKKEADFFVLRKTDMKAVLVELGFISNIRERDILNNPSNQKELGKGLAVGVAKVLGLSQKTPVVPPQVDNGGQGELYYRVVVASYKDRSNADKMVDELVSKGYTCFIDVFRK